MGLTKDKKKKKTKKNTMFCKNIYPYQQIDSQDIVFFLQIGRGSRFFIPLFSSLSTVTADCMPLY